MPPPHVTCDRKDCFPPFLRPWHPSSTIWRAFTTLSIREWPATMPTGEGMGFVVPPEATVSGRSVVPVFLEEALRRSPRGLSFFPRWQASTTVPVTPLKAHQLKHAVCREDARNPLTETLWDAFPFLVLLSLSPQRWKQAGRVLRTLSGVAEAFVLLSAPPPPPRSPCACGHGKGTEEVHFRPEGIVTTLQINHPPPIPELEDARGQMCRESLI